MIARISIPIILVILLTAKCIDWRYACRWRWPFRLMPWILALACVAATVVLALQKDYFPDRFDVLFLYLHILGFIVAPAAIFAFCSIFGSRKVLFGLPLGRFVGGLLAVLTVVCYAYGSFVGPTQLKVRYVELSFPDLPQAFDGYRIVQVSDLHLGSFINGREALLRQAVDSINAQDADLVAFCGDIQNKQPSEIMPFVDLLKTVKAKDAVCSVLGNHDYTRYIDEANSYLVERNMGLTRSIQTDDLGWTLLDNNRIIIHRDSSRIVVAGMENDGEGHFPQLGNINTALWGISREDFVVMIEHDPTSWRRKILPHSHAQITLSGHTHGGQFRLFGWTPASIIYREYDGIYRANGQSSSRVLSVTKGLGGVVPFRLACPPEIVVITLRKKQ